MSFCIESQIMLEIVKSIEKGNKSAKSGKITIHADEKAEKCVDESTNKSERLCLGGWRNSRNNKKIHRGRSNLE